MKRQMTAMALVSLSVFAAQGFAQSLHSSPHGDGMRGLAPATRSATPNILWQKVLPRGIAHGSITFSNNGQFLYFKTCGTNHQGQVFKVRASDGATVWATDQSVIGFGNFSYAGVTVDEVNGLVYTGGRGSSQPAGQGIIAALNINTGAPVWVRTAADLGIAGADFGRGNVLLSTDNTRVYVRDNGNPDRVVALNATTGALHWIYTSPFPSGVPFQTVGPVWRNAANGRDRIAMVNNQVVGSALVIEDQGNSAALVWSKDIAVGLNYHWWGNAVASLDFNTLYITSFQDAGNPVFTAVDTASGDIRWQIWPNVNTNGMNQYQNPVVGGDDTIYSGGRVVAPPPIMVGRAAVGNENDYWNTVTANNSIARPWTAINMRAGNDSATTVDVAIADFAESSTYPATDGDKLMRDYHYLGALGYNGPGTITLSDVPAGTYDLYLYSFTPIANDQNAVFTVGGSTKTVFPGAIGPFGGYVEDENYVVFRNISPDSSGTIQITVDIDFLNTFAVVNGLQLHGLSGSLANQFVNVDMNQLGNIGGGITAIRPDGSIKWQFRPEDSGEFSGWPVVTCGRVIYAADQVTFDNTRLYAVRDNGPDAQLLWTFTLAYNYFGNVAPSVGPDGTLYFSSVRDNDDNQILYAFAPANMGDVNGDGCVNDSDLLAVLFAFGQTGCLAEDQNGDGIVNDSDLLLVLFNFGMGC